MMSCLFFGCASEVGHLFENGVGHIHENKVGIFLENLGLMVGHFPEKSHCRLKACWLNDNMVSSRRKTEDFRKL